MSCNEACRVFMISYLSGYGISVLVPNCGWRYMFLLGCLVAIYARFKPNKVHCMLPRRPVPHLLQFFPQRWLSCLGHVLFLFVLYVVMCCEQRIFLAMQGAGAYCMCAKKVAIHRARATARPPGRGRYSTVFILYLLVLLLVPSLHFLFHCLIKRKVGNMNTTFLRYTK